ncbi:MAG: ATP-binding protein, partial [Polyangiaceae bacterium]|nr:ATP-binding protein [Polyangiaceae bacterium]
SLSRSSMNIRRLFWFAIAVALAVPLASIGALRLYEVSLLRTTERQLIAQSVVVGEVYRDLVSAGEAHLLPPGADDRFAPLNPHITARTPVGENLHFHTPCEPRVSPLNLSGSPREQSRGKKVIADRSWAEHEGSALPDFTPLNHLMQRMQLQNLSSMRVLDPQGCVLASTRGQIGLTLASAPEVQRAMNGDYGFALRKRESDEPRPPLGSIRRRGRFRVFAAVPVYSDNKLIGIIRASRTGLDPVSRLYQQRRSYVVFGIVCLGALFLLALLGSASIIRPLRSLTAHTRSLRAGKTYKRWQPPWGAPQETKELGAALDDAHEAIHRRANAIANFARDVSHELKTPITSIHGAAELRYESAEKMSPEQRSRFAKNIATDSARMSELVGRLLELTRLDNPTAFDESTVEQPREVILEAIQRYPETEYAQAGQESPLHMRKEHLESLVINLVENAYRHGEAPICVEVDFDASGMKLQVVDSGEGIPSDAIERVFEPFYTTARDQGGHGLGLNIIRAIAQGWGGQARIANRDGKNLVQIHIPLSPKRNEGSSS